MIKIACLNVYTFLNPFDKGLYEVTIH